MEGDKVGLEKNGRASSKTRNDGDAEGDFIGDIEGE
jgi:hypothetical protein